MNLKFEESELSDGKYLGAGDHNCRITKIEKKPSKKGGDNIEVEFTSAAENTTRDWFSISGNKFKLARLAVACGFTKEQLLAGQFDTAMLANKFVRVVREVTGEEAITDKDGKPTTRKNYNNTYLPSPNAKASAAIDDSIPF